MNRQSLASLLVGVFSVVAGLWVSTQLRIDRCLDAGGRWESARRACALPPGSDASTTTLTVVPFALGALVMLLSAFVLMRLWLAMSVRRVATPPSSSSTTSSPPPSSTPKPPAA